MVLTRKKTQDDADTAGDVGAATESGSPPDVVARDNDDAVVDSGLIGQAESTQRDDTANVDNPATVVTPLKPKIIVVRHHNGDEVPFHNGDDAREFQEAMKDTIARVMTFETDEAYENHKKLVAATPEPVANPYAKKTDSSDLRKRLTREEEEIAIKIKQARLLNKPTRQLLACWKTNTHTKAVCVGFKVLTEKGENYWLHRPRDFMETAKAAIDICPSMVGGDANKEMFQNLVYVEMRDPNGDEDAVLQVENKRKKYPLYVNYTHFILPVHFIKDANAEADYIEQRCTSFLNAVKKMCTDRVFLNCLKSTVEEYSDKIASYMFEKDGNKPTYAEFMMSCTLKVQKWDSFTDLVVKYKTADLNDIITRNRTPTNKYKM